MKTKMFLSLCLVFGLAAVCISTAYAEDTPVIGFIEQDTRWRRAESPYVTLGHVVVKEGVTLTIEPGVTIKFDSGHSLMIGGTLIARGTAEDSIKFTPKEDTKPGAWGGILFENSSKDAEFDEAGNYLSGSILQYCVVEFAGPGVKGESASAFIEHCRISNNGNRGIYINGEDQVKWVILTSNSLAGNAGDIYISGVERLTIIANTLDSDGSIYVSNVNTLTIIENTFNSNGGWSICVFEVDTVTISKNTLTGTITNGDYIGRGISASYVSRFTISENTITGYRLPSYYNEEGAGICVSEVDTLTISKNTLTGNSAYNGGGMDVCDVDMLTISKNILTGNSAENVGGGILVSNIARSIISENTLNGNSAFCTGGIAVRNWQIGGEVTIGKNTLIGNKRGGIDIQTAFATMNDNIFIGNEGNPALNVFGEITKMAITDNRFTGNSARISAILWNTWDREGTGEIRGNVITDNKGTYAVSVAKGNPTFNRNAVFNNQTDYNLHYGRRKGLPDLDATNNYWGVTTEAEIRAKIYDFFQDSDLALVDVVPFLTENPFGKEPNIQLAHSSYSFAGVSVGSYADWDLTISNVGDTTLTVNSITSDNPTFTIISPDFPQNVSPSDSLNVTVRFTPTEERLYTGTLTVASNDPDEPKVSVSVEAVGEVVKIPDLTLESKDFEFWQEATDTFKIVAWISNTGNIPATDVQVQFFDNDVPIGADTIRVPVGDKQNVAIVRWKLPGRKVENHELSVKIVSSNPPEQDTSNNEASRTISVYYVDSGRPNDPFRVIEDGYSFPNWGMNPEDAKESFRSWWRDQDLTDKVLRVLLFANPAMIAGIKGHCYGMAATSILYRDNPELKPVDEETYQMKKEDPRVVGKIRVYHAVGGLPSTLELLWIKSLGGYDVSEEYSKGFDYIANKNKPVLQILAHKDRLKSGSHAVTGYMILDLGDEKRVYVYENETPGSVNVYVRYDLAQKQGEIYDHDLVLSRYPFVDREKLKGIISDLWTDFIQSLKEKGRHLFFLGSPAYLTVTDSFGRRAGFVAGEMVNEIPDASIEEFGGAQAIYAPNDLTYRIETTGADTGSITLDIIATGIGEEAKQISYEDIPILPDSKTYIDFDPASPDFTMSVDKDGDGIAEETRRPDSVVRTDEILVVTPPTEGDIENTYAYPNPFNPDRESATLRFSLSKSAKVTVKLYDAGGRLVTTLTEDEYIEAKEEQSLPWDGKNDKGDIVANGVYFCVITTDQGERAVCKVAVLR